MKCANHPHLDAVATCVDCGKGLCVDCAHTFDVPICNSCNAARVQGEKSVLVKNIILTAVFFVIGFYIARDNIMGGIVIGYIFAGIPWGWSFLNKITPSIFLFLPLIGWVIYFFIKGILSLFIGFIALPVKIFQMVRDGKRLKGITQTISGTVE